jgi:isocitrate/isopropylmalate dehydrogenase
MSRSTRVRALFQASSFAFIYSARRRLRHLCEKSQQPRVRTAVDRVVEEHEIPVADNAGDLHAFMDEHEDIVLHTLEDAVNRHR